MSTSFKTFLLMSAGILLFISGCATMPSESVPSRQAPEPRAAVPGPERTDRMKEPSPRTVASLRMTEQARVLIESKKPDEAIRILEKALNIDPHNGQNYYFLAEAWLMKGNRMQAHEFNRIAGIYLDDNSGWMSKVRRQEERIEKVPQK